MREKLRELARLFVFILMIGLFAWLFFIKEDSGERDVSDLARNRYFLLDDEVERRNINTQAENIVRGMNFSVPSK